MRRTTFSIARSTKVKLIIIGTAGSLLILLCQLEGPSFRYLSTLRENENALRISNVLRPQVSDAENSQEINCERKEGRHLIQVEDGQHCILENRTIFFLETDPNFESFGGRKLCSFESTAKHNPKASLMILIPHKNELAPNDLAFLKGFPNIFVSKTNFDKLILQVPGLEGLLQALLKSKHYSSQITDVLRVLLLHLYGGTYLDTDVISLKPLPAELANFVVEDFWPLYNGGGGTIDFHHWNRFGSWKVFREFVRNQTWDASKCKNLRHCDSFPIQDLNHGVMSFEKEHEFLGFMIETLAKLSPHQLRRLEKIRNILGPRLLSTTVANFCPEINAQQGDTPVRYLCPSGLKVLKKTFAHSWDAFAYLGMGRGMDYSEIKAGLENSFLAHYFGSRFDSDISWSTLRRNSTLLDLMDENCPLAAKIVKNEIDAR